MFVSDRAMLHLPPNLSAAAANERVADLFRGHGWIVEKEPDSGSIRPDLIAKKGPLRYAIELKSVSEGRPDRVVALLSQAILQASRYAEHQAMAPLAVVYVGQASESLLRKVEEFRDSFAPHVAVGIVSDIGKSRFIGPGLEDLNIEPRHSFDSRKIAKPHKASDLFSDLNQWMLKVLLAPEIPEQLINAPRREYRSVSDLASAAEVSPMSASRFARRLQEEGFLEESARSLRLVRRRELFRRWQSSAMRPSPELHMSHLIPAKGREQFLKVASHPDACVGLFAAADLLNLGHVSGVPPHVYVRRLSAVAHGWPDLVPAKAGESVQVILKQPNAPESLFRGAVRVDGVRVSDVVQIWLDASAHPSRGAEQAEFLGRKVLKDVFGDQQ